MADQPMSTVYTDGMTRVSKDGKSIATYNAAANKWTVSNNPNAPIGSPVPKLGPEVQARLKNLSAASDIAGQYDSDAQELIAHNKRVGTGGLLGAPIIGGPLTDFIANNFSPDLAAIKHLNLKLAGNIRAPGQRLTQVEILQNQRGTLGPTHNLQANEALGTDAAHNDALARAKNAFYSTWANQHGGIDGNADAAWTQFQAQHFASDGSYHHDPIGAATPQTPQLKYLGTE